MVTATDVKSGYGQKKATPYNSIIPYLRSKQLHIEHNPAVTATQEHNPAVTATQEDDPEGGDNEEAT